ncbi:hypothetical protein SAMD00023353_2601200 [Rosellinia necatrix]|uniref:Uncharacterized protein n=1 Tax=Rosellinia necatrix TaxID=77044 RepID=A0A1W2TH46_ROSNE|nr:hypothetical protein SAMD00023353_2601200 [Rosellinia necatrix]
MESINILVARGKSALASRDLSDSDSWDSAVNATIALLGLALFGLALVGTLLMLQRQRQRQQLPDQALPRYDDIEHEAGRNTRRLTIQTPGGKSNIVVVNGRPMLADPNAPPHSPNNVPEIHITFPDEQDEHGSRKTGRVLLVRVGETTIGLEPLKEEQLPAYEKDSNNTFYSIDMDRIGGLKEKDQTQFA